MYNVTGGQAARTQNPVSALAPFGAAAPALALVPTPTPTHAFFDTNVAVSGFFTTSVLPQC